MLKKAPSHTWKKQKQAKDFEVFDCKEYDPIKDFRMEPTGVYVLIRINFTNSRIELGVCDAEHHLLKAFSGRKAQDIYDALFQYETQHQHQWFTEKTHMAYIGKELKKAELALVIGNNAYFQE